MRDDRKRSAANQNFIDCLRNWLGLQPLYAPDAAWMVRSYELARARYAKRRGRAA